jgi:hypothetical protein
VRNALIRGHFRGCRRLAKAADQFRTADVTVWAVIALSCWAAAIFLGNVSALVPANVMAGLHASRLEGGTIGQLRGQVASIAAENDRMRRENNLLIRRLDIQQEAQGEVTRRVGALEISLPNIVERLPETATIDNSATASIAGGTALSFDTEGGSVSVVQKPLIALQSGIRPRADEAALPPVAYDGTSVGVALGFPIDAGDGEVQWQNLLAKVGTLLIGLQPVLGDAPGSDGMLVIAGPLETKSQAAELCGRLDRVGIPCEPTAFKGEPLPLLN